MKRYTLVYHSYIGYGSYVVDFKRVKCKPEQLDRYYKKSGDLHFIIAGWPNITHPDHQPVFDGVGVSV